jgi:hypothetical protein
MKKSCFSWKLTIVVFTIDVGGFQSSEFLFSDLHELGRDQIVAGRRLLDGRRRSFHLLLTFIRTLQTNHNSRLKIKNWIFSRWHSKNTLEKLKLLSWVKPADGKNVVRKKAF